MPWFRVDDTFAFNDKVIEAEQHAPGSVSAWVRMGSHCAAQLTDGRVSTAVARAIASPSQIEALLKVRFLIATGTGYEIHDYLKYQPSKAEVEFERSKARDRMRSKRTNVRPNFAGTSQEVLEGMGGDLKSDSESVSESELPGNPTAAVKRVVDRWRPMAEEILAGLNAARKRVRSSSRGITLTYDNLALIAERLEGGASAEDCLHVVEVCEAECRANADAFRWFDSVTPFRRENFARKCAADPALASAASTVSRTKPANDARPAMTSAEDYAAKVAKWREGAK